MLENINNLVLHELKESCLIQGELKQGPLWKEVLAAAAGVTRQRRQPAARLLHRERQDGGPPPPWRTAWGPWVLFLLRPARPRGGLQGALESALVEGKDLHLPVVCGPGGRCTSGGLQPGASPGPSPQAPASAGPGPARDWAAASPSQPHGRSDQASQSESQRVPRSRPQ